MDAKLKSKWLEHQDIEKNISLKFQDYPDIEIAEKIKIAVVLWRFCKNTINKTCSTATKIDFLESFLESQNEFVVLVAKMEMLPDFIFRKLLWRKNIDFMDFESCLRRLTKNPDKIEAIHRNYQVLCIDKKVPPVLSSFSFSIVDAILVLFGYYTYAKINKASILNENGKRYDAKGEWLYNLGHLDFGFAKYHKGIWSDEFLTNKSPLDFFLNKEKTDGTDTNFYVNTDDGMYFRFFVFTRSWLTFKPIFNKDHKVVLPRAICPGFWVTVLIGFEFLVNPFIGLLAAPSNLIAYIILWLLFLLISMIFLTRVLFKKENLGDGEKIVVWGILYPISFIGLLFAYSYASTIVFVVATAPLLIWLVVALLIFVVLGCVRLYKKQPQTIKSLGSYMFFALLFVLAILLGHLIVKAYLFVYEKTNGTIPQIQLHVLIAGLILLVYSVVSEVVNKFDDHASKNYWHIKSVVGTAIIELMLVIIKYYLDIFDFGVRTVKWIGSGISSLTTTTTRAIIPTSHETSPFSFTEFLLGVIIVASYLTAAGLIAYISTYIRDEMKLYKNRKTLVIISAASNSIVMWHAYELMKTSSSLGFMSLIAVLIIITSLAIIGLVFQNDEQTIIHRNYIVQWQQKADNRNEKIWSTNYVLANKANKKLLMLDKEVVKSRLNSMYSVLHYYFEDKSIIADLMILTAKKYDEKLFEKFEKLRSLHSTYFLIHEKAKVQFFKLIIEGESIDDSHEKAKAIENELRRKAELKYQKESSHIPFDVRVENWKKANPWFTSITRFISFVFSYIIKQISDSCKVIWKIVVTIVTFLFIPIRKLYHLVLSGALMAEKMSKECPMTPPPTEVD